MDPPTGSPGRVIAIIGNPNSGKSAVFNALTGLRQKVANYPGVTVEKKEGRLVFRDGSEARLIDLPGTYSLSAASPDERIAVDVLLGSLRELPRPELVVCVVDASNLERNLFLVSQILDSRLPVVVALNMMDIAEERGMTIDLPLLASGIGVTVMPTVANKNIGIENLRSAIEQDAAPTAIPAACQLPGALQRAWDNMTDLLIDRLKLTEPQARHESIALLSGSQPAEGVRRDYPPPVIEAADAERKKLEFLGIDAQSAFVESRYAWIRRILASSVTGAGTEPLRMSDRIDTIVTHKVWGFVIFIILMGAIFQTIFAWSNVPMELIGKGFDRLGGELRQILPAGDLQNLLINGALAGVGAVVTFLPQIAFLFFFLALLEDSGYMARAAFIMDRVMGKVGLHGKAFIPLLSSFACAIPGIMATRTIDSRKDRLVTMLVAPLLSCSARLPIYTLLIGAFIPQRYILGIFPLPGLVMITLYVAGFLAALIMAWILKKTLFMGEIPAFIMELPPYKKPSPKSVLLHVGERCLTFLKQAGTFILGVSIILWFLASYPKTDPGGTSSHQLEQSFAGRTGHLLEPLIAPLGFDWKIGIGLVTSMLQREVFVSTMGTIYNIRDADHDQGNISLRDHLRNDINPETGRASFSILTAICVMVYYLLAMQCMSTVAVMRRETNGWRWPVFQFAYMTGLAYGVTFLVYRIGLLLMTT